jgi:hypothetical protein
VLYLYVCVMEVPECASEVEEAESVSEGVDYDAEVPGLRGSEG